MKSHIIVPIVFFSATVVGSLALADTAPPVPSQQKPLPAPVAVPTPPICEVTWDAAGTPPKCTAVKLVSTSTNGTNWTTTITVAFDNQPRTGESASAEVTWNRLPETGPEFEIGVYDATLALGRKKWEGHRGPTGSNEPKAVLRNPTTRLVSTTAGKKEFVMTGGKLLYRVSPVAGTGAADAIIMTIAVHTPP